MMNTLIEYANSTGDRWATWVVTTTVETAVLLALVTLLWLAIRNRVAQQVGYCLFLLVPLKVLVPIEVAIPAKLANWSPSAIVSSYVHGSRDAERFASRSRLTQRLRTSRRTTRADRAECSSCHGHDRRLFGQVPSLLSVRSLLNRTWKATTSGSARASSTAKPARLSWEAIAMIAWLGGVALLLVKLARAQWRFRATLEHSTRLDASRLPFDLRELFQRAGCRQSIVIVENDGITAPAVWGIVRPTIILPRGIIDSLPAQQLRWLMLHELAHIKRCDLAVVALQRIAAILHFFNPMIWIANRVIHRLREYACDDLALSVGGVSGVDSGEAFLRDPAARRTWTPRTRGSARLVRTGFAILLFSPRSPAARY